MVTKGLKNSNEVLVSFVIYNYFVMFNNSFVIVLQLLRNSCETNEDKVVRKSEINNIH